MTQKLTQKPTQAPTTDIPAPASPGLNRLVLTAQVLVMDAMRYTPAGLPAQDLSLKHESELLQNGQPRKVSMEIRARGIGEVAKRLARLEIGSHHGFAGFLSNQRNGRGVVFHVTELD